PHRDHVLAARHRQVRLRRHPGAGPAGGHGRYAAGRVFRHCRKPGGGRAVRSHRPAGAAVMSESLDEASRPGFAVTDWDAPPPNAFLEVRDLRVHFPTDDGLVKAVDGLSFTLER